MIKPPEKQQAFFDIIWFTQECETHSERLQKFIANAQAAQKAQKAAAKKAKEKGKKKVAQVDYSEIAAIYAEAKEGNERLRKRALEQRNKLEDTL